MSRLTLFGRLKKRKIQYSEKYGKDSVFNPQGRKTLQTQINVAERVFAIEAGKYDDGKEYLIIKIDGL